MSTTKVKWKASMMKSSKKIHKKWKRNKLSKSRPNDTTIKISNHKKIKCIKKKDKKSTKMKSQKVSPNMEEIKNKSESEYDSENPNIETMEWKKQLDNPKDDQFLKNFFCNQLWRFDKTNDNNNILNKFKENNTSYINMLGNDNISDDEKIGSEINSFEYNYQKKISKQANNERQIQLKQKLGDLKQNQK